MTTTEKLQELRRELARQFPERQNVIDGTLAAVLAGEHVLFLGPPGTAKSALARSIAQAFSGRYFERLLTRFSTPDELFGPVSLRALEQDRFERVIAGKLPEAEFVFLDECWKASSSILNSLLTLMNERIYHNDGAPIACPLITLVGASNELPEGRELEALFDRFLVRFDVQYLVQLANLRAVLTAPDPTTSSRLTMDDLRQAQSEAEKVVVTDQTIDTLVAIRDACHAEGIVASDRRWKKCLRLVRAAAYLMGETKTATEDLLLLVDSLWREPKERNKVARIVGQKADPVSAQATEILECARESSKKVSALAKGDHSAYVGAAVKAIEQFVEQKNRLAELGRTGGAGGGVPGKRSKVAISDAQTEIQGLHAETQRVVSTSLGLSSGPRGVPGLQ